MSPDVSGRLAALIVCTIVNDVPSFLRVVPAGDCRLAHPLVNCPLGGRIEWAFFLSQRSLDAPVGDRRPFSTLSFEKDGAPVRDQQMGLMARPTSFSHRRDADAPRFWERMGHQTQRVIVGSPIRW